ncbi:MAG: glutathione S-transferase N-terminal domain-containing protein [Geminicoccaceae bacterium]|nr:glutathione S-transferase N-terminal domain-containing protein [Geminicoccaceae bacterium]MCX8102135.1 glutathione S-transferase N-terminal domain-containing protein [Geminicoccaceae bacterium]MDW8370431.1 glutathione S-transferase N-terminal domain-containing protein [Geminicoccaceae bacterium]
MIDLYTAATSNGQRASIMLEATGLPYRAHKVDLASGEQRAAAFLRLNPAGQIPVIVDHGGPGGAPLAIAQSGAIMLYLAERSGRFLPSEGRKRAAVLEAFMQVLTDVAPASAALFYMSKATEPPHPEVMAFCKNRFLSMLAQVDRRLARHPWLAGEEISIADFALYPTVAARKAILEEAQGLSDLQRWAQTMAARPDVARGMAVPA